MKIEAVSIDIFHGELAQTPRLLLERFNDFCTASVHWVFAPDIDATYEELRYQPIDVLHACSIGRGSDFATINLSSTSTYERVGCHWL
jgi:hypothetical protein